MPNLLLSRWNSGEDHMLTRIYESHYPRLKQRAERILNTSKHALRYSPEELVHGIFFRLQRCRERNCHTVEQLLDLAQRFMQDHLTQPEPETFSWSSGPRVRVG
jgi:hypothetical protein